MTLTHYHYYINISNGKQLTKNNNNNKNNIIDNTKSIVQTLEFKRMVECETLREREREREGERENE